MAKYIVEILSLPGPRYSSFLRHKQRSEILTGSP